MAQHYFPLMALALGLSTIVGGCASATKAPHEKSFVDKMGASVKSGTSKMVAAVTPDKKTPSAQAAEPQGKPKPQVFVAAARMHERSGRLDEAEASYRKALEMKPNYLDAMIGYARLEDRRSNFEAATRMYQKAIKKHPKDASVHNDLGLCYHRRGKLPDATRELKRAVDLDGENKLYRNNLAAVYVEQGKDDDALVQLTAAHGRSVAHYNMGYLLMQKENPRGAMHHFQTAAHMDPNLVAAQQWVARLSGGHEPQVTQVRGQAYAQAPQQQSYPPQGQAPPAYVAQRIPPQGAYAPQPAPQPGGAYASQSQYGAPQNGGQQQPYAPQSDPMPPLPNRY